MMEGDLMPEEEKGQKGWTVDDIMKLSEEVQKRRGRRCLRCGHVWNPRRRPLEGDKLTLFLQEPHVCPQCGSRQWNVAKPDETAEEVSQREKVSQRDRERAREIRIWRRSLKR